MLCHQRRCEKCDAAEPSQCMYVCCREPGTPSAAQQSMEGSCRQQAAPGAWMLRRLALPPPTAYAQRRLLEITQTCLRVPIVLDDLLHEEGKEPGLYAGIWTCTHGPCMHVTPALLCSKPVMTFKIVEWGPAQ
jgi:hypothetical protein